MHIIITEYLQGWALACQLPVHAPFLRLVAALQSYDALPVQPEGVLVDSQPGKEIKAHPQYLHVLIACIAHHLLELVLQHHR